jgi:hypothetical protein
LLDASIILAKRHSFAILLATLPALVPAVLLDIGIHLLTGGSDFSLIAMPASLMLWGLAEGMAIAASWDLLHGEQPNATRAWRLVGRRPLAVALGYCFKWLMIMLGLFLLIAPGFYLIGRWFAVPATSVVEHATLHEAFRRSRQLVRNDLTRVLWTLGLVESGEVLGAFVVPALLPGASLESPSLAQTASYWALGVVLLPLRAGLTAMLYLDIRMRREGYDLQQRLSGLDGAA